MSLPGWKILAGAVLSVAYLIVAIVMVHSERTSTGGGGFITLRGMGSWLITFPVSLPMELLGSKIDFRSNVQIGAAILVCTGLVFGLGLGLAKLGELAWLALSPR